ncbi:MAG: hypothetical protein R3C28_27260 [Pirellulaceae bacterium]
MLTATLVADQVQAFENGDAMTLDVLANDSFSDDYEGDRQITSVSFGSQGGRISINSDHQSCEPRASRLCEAKNRSCTVDNQFYSTVNVSIQSPLQDDEFTLPPDGQAHSLNVLGSDRFWDGYTGARQITLVSTTNADSVQIQRGWQVGGVYAIYVRTRTRPIRVYRGRKVFWASDHRPNSTVAL